MPTPYTGGCQCGAIRYEVTDEPLTLYACHCTACQKQSSSAFGMTMKVAREAFRITRGEPKSFTSYADSGKEKRGYFCGACGTRIYGDAPSKPEIVSLKPGTLDDTRWLRPVGNLWTDSAQPWVPIDKDALNYPRQPESQDDLNARWKAQSDRTPPEGR